MSSNIENVKSKKLPKVVIILIAFGLVVGVAVTILAVTLFQGTKAPPSYTLSNRTLTISGQFGRTIDLTDATVEYMSNGVPDTPVHTNGAGLGKIERGTFSLNGTSVYKNIMDKNSQYYILITRKSSSRFYINCVTSQQTNELYNDIVEHKQ